MNARAITAWFVVAAVATSAACAADSQPADPRLREVLYDPRAVVTVPVKRGVVTLVVLDPDEAITEVAAGLGGDCGDHNPGGRRTGVHGFAPAAGVLISGSDRYAITTNPNGFSRRSRSLASTLG